MTIAVSITLVLSEIDHGVSMRADIWNPYKRSWNLDAGQCHYSGRVSWKEI